MSRTYRDIPDWGRKAEEEEYIDLAPDGWRSRVPDKDNHGCLYSKPSEFTDDLNAKMRTLTSQKLRHAVNCGWGEEDFEEMVLPHPRQYNEWWW